MSTALHLAYHYVREGKAPGPNCTPARLRKQVGYLRERGFQFLTCGDVGRMRTEQASPECYVVLSFDDGLSDHYKTVFPILKEYGVRATFFIIGCTLQNKFPPVIGFQALIDRLGAERMEQEILPAVLAHTRYGPLCDLVTLAWLNSVGLRQGEPPELRVIKYLFNDLLLQSLKCDLLSTMFTQYLGIGSQERLAAEWFLNREQLMEMECEDMEIGAHSMTHPFFSAIGFDEVSEEIQASATTLIPGSGRPIESFAYPFGEKYSPEVRKKVAEWFVSGWNYLSIAEDMPPPPYALDDMPRLNESKCALFGDF